MAGLQPKSKPDTPSGNFDFLFLQLMMVMMAFFILLSSMAVIVDKKRTQALDSVANAFSILPAGADIKNSSDGGDVEAAHAANDLTEVSKLLDMRGSVSAMQLDKHTILVRLPTPLLFAPGKIELSTTIAPFLDILADLLRRDTVASVYIEGHTDTSPPGHGFKSNWELSAARAMQVYLAMVKRGVPKQRMVVVGMGATHPLEQSHGNPGKNRRVEIRIAFRQSAARHAGQPGHDTAPPRQSRESHHG